MAETVGPNGGTGGFRSFVGFDPAAGRAIAVLANDAIPRAIDAYRSDVTAAAQYLLRG